MAMLTGSNGEFLRTLVTPQPYKPGQGTYTRQGTFATIVVLVLYGMYSWMQMQSANQPFVKWGVPLIGGAIGCWIAYRVIHFPRFADFLISTEAEMNKVSWPSWRELKISTVVVLLSTVFLAVFLFVADTCWQLLLSAMGILKIGGLLGGSIQGMIPPGLIGVVQDLGSLLF